MNPKIIKFAQLLAKRPKDRTIAIIRIVAGLTILSVVYFGRHNYALDLPFGWEKHEVYIEYGLMVFGVLPIIGGLTRLCIIKHKHLRVAQICMGLWLMFLGWPIMDPEVPKVPAPTEVVAEVELGAEATSDPQVPHNPGWILGLLGFLPLFMGITGKGTYSHCIKYREKITTIRV